MHNDVRVIIYDDKRDPLAWDRDLRKSLDVPGDATAQDISQLIRDEEFARYDPQLECVTHKGRQWWLCHVRMGDIFYRVQIDDQTGQQVCLAYPTPEIALLEALKFARFKDEEDKGEDGQNRIR